MVSHPSSTVEWGKVIHSFGTSAGSRQIVADPCPQVSGVVQIVGPSGAGKSTMLSIAAGLLQPTSGELFYNSATSPEDLRKRGGVAVQFQKGYLEAYLTLRENVALFASEGADIDALLEQSGLANFADSRADTLSGGQVKRAGLIRALAAEPEVLIVDEPLAELDAASKQVVSGLLSAFSGAGGLVLCASHEKLTGLNPLTEVRVRSE